MSNIRLFHKANLALKVLKYRHYIAYTAFGRTCVLNPRHASQTSYFTPLKHFSNCSSMQSKDKDSSKKSSDEYMQKVLEDDEFQSILKDFANDFEVNESDDVLGDIRKNIEEEKDISDNKHCSRNDTSLICSNKDLQKYKEFLDTDSSIIYSYEEQYENTDDDPIYHVDHELKPKVISHNVERGITGVFDIDDLIPALQSESLLDITTISIPKEFHYADYLVLATAKSARHCKAAAEFIIKLYKQKKNKKDPFVKVEGEKIENWKAIDMGNIVLHILLEETRALYDIESLWLFDANFDTGGNMQEDPALKIIEEQIAFFNSMRESSTSTEMPEPVS